MLQAVHISERAGDAPVDKSGRPTMQHHHLNLTARHQPAGEIRGAVDRGIRAFLAGETHGEDVLKRLYGHVIDEPVPERLRALLKR